MKKNIILLSLSLLLIGCGEVASTSNGTTTSENTTTSQEDVKVKVLAPDGTPSLALANFYHDNTSMYTIFDVQSGADPLKAAFVSGEYDVIVAPTNLGSIFYNKNQGEKYVLYQTIVWGNLYVVCDEEITSFADLANKDITLFGQNSTPDIVMKSLASYYNISYNANYVNDVTASTSAYISGTSHCVVSAQPVLTKLNAKLQNAHILDLQSEWAKMTSSASYPQASIFFKESLKGKIDNVLKAMTESVKKANENPSITAENATSMYKGFETLGKEVLENAIPKCHYAIEENQKEAIEFYFNKMKDLSLDAQFGGKLPDENFYYSI